MRVLVLVELIFVNAGFCEGKKIGVPGEKPSEQGERQQQTQPKYVTVPESNPGHIAWR